MRQQHSAIPVMGVELEWYVLDANGVPISQDVRVAYLQAFSAAAQSLPLHSVSSERGRGQVEAALWHTDDVSAIPLWVDRLKAYAYEVAAAHGLQACFAAKPFAEDYGSGVHVHIHMQDVAGESLYWKRGDLLSPALAHSIGGLLAAMQDDLPVFAGSDEAYARYASGFDAPIAVNWGFNNRTTALRLPDGLGEARGLEAVLSAPPSTHRRIEHRVASAEADIEAVVLAILQAIEVGLRERIAPPPPVYGIAHVRDMQQLFKK
jgi:glutamine synthetase